METELIEIVPVLPASNIDRDTDWYRDKTGFGTVFKDKMYARIKKGKSIRHLQWHADTKDDPLLGGSVIRIFVKNIQPIFEEFVERKTVSKDNIRLKTDWNTNEFGFYDLNNNAIFIVEAIE